MFCLTVGADNILDPPQSSEYFYFEISSVTKFTISQLILWYRENARKMPWRDTTDPYKIWLSEIILQQTRVLQGLPYYNKFIENYPTVELLARATLDEVFNLWAGLGYYSRAKNLHKAAQKLANEMDGKFPDKLDDLLKLPGIGPYTGRAIASLAFNKKVAVLDGNVFRVLSRVLADETLINTSSSRQYYQTKVDHWLGFVETNQFTYGEFNSAIMELGATICTPSNPNCKFCPLNEVCQSKGTSNATRLPIKSEKSKAREINLHYLFYTNNDNLFPIQKRPNSGIWQNLWELPIIEPDKISTVSQNKVEFVSAITHKLTHIDMMISLWTIAKEDSHIFEELFPDKSQFSWINWKAEFNHGFPKAIKKLLDIVRPNSSNLFREF